VLIVGYRRTVNAIAYSSIFSNFPQFCTWRISRPVNPDNPLFAITIRFGISRRLSSFSLVRLGKAFSRSIARIGLASKLRYSKVPASSNDLGTTVSWLPVRFSLFKCLRRNSEVLRHAVLGRHTCATHVYILRFLTWYRGTEDSAILAADNN